MVQLAAPASWSLKHCIFSPCSLPTSCICTPHNASDLVAGTLRDQLLYPEPPRAVWATASLATRARVEPWMKSLRMGEEELEERLRWVGRGRWRGGGVCGRKLVLGDGRT